MFIKKLTTIFFVLLIALLNLGDNRDNVYEVSDFGLNERVSYHNDYSFSYDNQYSYVSDYDNIIIGKVVSHDGFAPSVENDMTEVHTLLTVEVIFVLKGNVSMSNIHIKYFGGVLNDILYVSDPNNKSEQEILPKEDMFFVFSYNNITIDNNGYYNIYNHYQINYLDITNENNIYENDEVINIIGSINSLENEQYAVNGTGNELEGPPIGGGGTTNDGSSFSSAIQIMPGYTISGEFENGQERKYYKFQGMPVNNYYLATINNIYDQTNTNVGVYLYNSLNDLLDYDIDSNFGNLFKLDTSISGGEYFVMIELQSLSPTPSYQFKIEFDSTCNCINAPENLAFNQNSVQNGEILFVNESQYNSEINYAVSLWNQEEIVNISEDSNGFVLVEDAYLGSEGLVARAIQFFGIFTSKIQLNSYYYETMNFYERVKTITHEFGHLLGMDEFNGDYLISTETVTNAMVQGIRELYELGPCDKLMFRYLH